MNNISQLVEKQSNYMDNTLCLIASENIPFPELQDIFNYKLFGKYAEGEINKRYYEGCQYVDQIEAETKLACNNLFNTSFCNVQVSSGTIANMTVICKLLNIGDIIISLKLSHGGHLSHGFKSTLIGKFFTIYNYHVNTLNNSINYDEIDFLIKNTNAKLLILGYSSCTFDIDYQKIRNIINKYNKSIYILADIAHISGLISSGLMNNPFPHVDVITSTTHKQLRGPRGAFIAWNNPKFNFTSFPLLQGGPDINSIAMKGKTFQLCNTNEYRNYCKQILSNAKIFQKYLSKYFTLVHPMTHNHMLLIKIENAKDFAKKLEKFQIIVNFNFLFDDDNVPNGIRLGVSYLTSRGAKENIFIQLALCIYNIYHDIDLINTSSKIKLIIKQLS